MNHSLEQFNAIVSGIYDAVLNPSHWPSVLEDTCKVLNAAAAGLNVHDTTSRVAQLVYSWGDDPRYSALYIERLAQLNPFVTASAGAKTGDIQCVSEMMSDEEYRASPFYKEYCVPQGYGDVMAVILERTATMLATVSVVRMERDGPFDSETMRFIRMLAPHFRRAALIGRVIEFHRSEAEVLTEALDQFSGAIFLVDADGRIQFANTAAKSLLGQPSPLTVAHGRLVAHNGDAMKALRAGIAAAAVSDAAFGVHADAIPLDDLSRTRWLGHLLPLMGGQRRSIGRSFNAVAALFVRQQPDHVQSWQNIAQIYRLTPTEQRVLQTLVELGGVPETAAKLGVAVGTVKTHLQSLFDKTGVRRQVELVKLVAETESPFRH